jgi:mannose-6-phosphate isomerase
MPYLDGPIRLLPIFKERIWGRTNLAPYFASTGHTEPIGEIWYTSSENQTSLGISLGGLIETEPGILGTNASPAHPDVCPLLAKMLFTTDRLSVQVHPDDEYAEKHHKSLGKTEAWYVVDAQPAAEVAVGFRERLTPERLRDAARTGEIEALLDWRRVKPGDVIYVPAGTVHAIGAGVTICEVQENSDITYRLYDYGRPRELHLEHGMKVSRLGPHEHDQQTIPLAPWRDQLVANSYFRIERLRLRRAARLDAKLSFYLLLICLRGTGTIAEQPFEPGECWLIPAGASELEIAGRDLELLLTYTSPSTLEGLHIA